MAGVKGKRRKVILLQTCSIYDSLTEASKAVKGARVDTISGCCNRKRESAAGCVWRYADEMLERAAEQGKTLRKVCDEELTAIAVRTIYGVTQYAFFPRSEVRAMSKKAGEAK